MRFNYCFLLWSVLVGAGLRGELVQVSEQDHDIVLSYANYPFRRIALSSLSKANIL